VPKNINSKILPSLLTYLDKDWSLRRVPPAASHQQSFVAVAPRGPFAS
jgi:hypothetical protein